MVLVSTPASTLVVNPAFLREIKDSNPDFYEAIQELRLLCQRDLEPAQLCRELTRLLDSIRDQLALHFSLEESYGYIHVAQASSRTMGELAANAVAQHGMLYMQLSDLAEQAEELQYRGVEPVQLRKLVQRAREFDEQLQKHERDENELIRRSYDLS